MLLPPLRLVAALFLLLGFAQATQAQQFPKLTGRVVDAANIIPDAEEQQLSLKLADLEKQSRRQLVVVTLPSLQGYEISDYGYQLGRHWGLGDKQRNDGALLIVAPNERKVRVEVGYGLEPVLTDGLSFLIIQNIILPRFKSGDMAGGISAGTDAIIHQLTLPAEEARKVAEQAQQKQQAQADSGDNIGGVFFLIIFVLFFILPLFARGRAGRRYGAAGLPVIIWGGSSGGFGGGGGFGGFSGGGGSFGGGGSSGSW